MAHYALLDENNVVVDVITGIDENDLPDGIVSWEEHYGNFHGLRCLRTSYNTQNNEHIYGGTPFRGNYAGIGYLYLEEHDIFVPPKFYNSWVLDLDMAVWIAPIPYPNDGNEYVWNEDSISWDIVSTGIS
jgi:hypothetical protein